MHQTSGSQVQFKRVLLKISGEALMGDQGYGLHPPTVERIAAEVKTVHDLGAEICMVIPHRSAPHTALCAVRKRLISRKRWATRGSKSAWSLMAIPSGTVYPLSSFPNLAPCGEWGCDGRYGARQTQQACSPPEYT